MKIKVFNHSDKKLDTALKAVSSYSPIPIFWEVVSMKSASPKFDGVWKDGKQHIDKRWFRETYSANAKGFDFCVAVFSERQWKKPSRKNRLAGQSIEESYGVSEIALYGSLTKKAKRPLSPNTNDTDFVVRLLHEMCHGMFDHKLKVQDVTHVWHYDKGNLLEAIKLWSQSNREKLYQTAVSCLGTDASPNDVAPDELGCAETVNAIHQKAFWKPIGGGLSTYQMYAALKNSPYFIKVDVPMRGDIIISPSGYGNGGLSNGHVGIVGDGNVMSNDSFTGLFSTNFTLETWRKRYVLKGGYPMNFFRRI